LKVVYHLSDLDKVSFVVGNIRNHLDGVGGPDNVTIALVVHGQALRAFHASSANPELSKHVGQFSKAGLELAACGNTMKSQKVGLADLLPGFVAADKGGVVRIAELQSQDYLYLRPDRSACDRERGVHDRHKLVRDCSHSRASYRPGDRTDAHGVTLIRPHLATTFRRAKPSATC
jgi:intracellular sulfur oxidation DsrE/DsrF family protein